MITAYVANAFCTAPVQEKVWATAGPGYKEGCIVEIQRPLYSLGGASRSYSDFFGDQLYDMGFIPSRADPDLWLRKAKDHDAYNYIATWVDDLILLAKDPQKYIHDIQQYFVLRNVESNPEFYLGATKKWMPDGRLHVSCDKYIKEIIRKYESDQ